MTELWREINGFLDYKVSTFGRVMSCKFGKEKILKYSISRGYRAIVLCKNNKTTYISVHRLVALTFLPNYYNLPQVDHKDRNRQNNSIYNLRWVSLSEQQLNRSITRNDILETDPIKRRNEIKNSSNKKIVEAKKFYCNTCNKAFQSNRDLVRHYTSKKHITTKSTSPKTN
jgi:hypothetical protein